MTPHLPMAASLLDAAPWVIFVFASRESAPELLDSLRAIVASTSIPLRVDVLINGNAELAPNLAQLCENEAWPASMRLRIWQIPLGDKSNAWNLAIHRVWAGEPAAFFLDGYVRPLPGAFEALARCVLQDDGVLGGTAVPSGTYGAERMRRQMLRSGGFHGNFCCLTARAIQHMRAQSIHLPLGLYRGDGLIGGLLALDFDPHGTWVPGRVYVLDRPCWQITHKPLFSWSYWRGEWRRRQRQARGDLENLALRDWLRVQRQPPGDWPADVETLLLAWGQRCPDQLAASMRFRPLARRAWRVIQQFQSVRDQAGARVMWSNGDEQIRPHPSRRNSDEA